MKPRRMHVFLKSKRQVYTTSNVESVMNEVFCKIMKKQKISGGAKLPFNIHSRLFLPKVTR